MTLLMNSFCLTLLLCCTLLAQSPALRWVDFQPPLYPRLAQIAHIQGTIAINFELSDDALKVLSVDGHPLLQAAALESLKGSKLRCENCINQSRLFSVVYDFRVAERACDDPAINSVHQPTLDSPSHVSVLAEPVCTYDPAATTRVRSIRCLYLWKCGLSKD